MLCSEKNHFPASKTGILQGYFLRTWRHTDSCCRSEAKEFMCPCLFHLEKDAIFLRWWGPCTRGASWIIQCKWRPKILYDSLVSLLNLWDQWRCTSLEFALVSAAFIFWASMRSLTVSSNEMHLAIAGRSSPSRRAVMLKVEYLFLKREPCHVIE